MSENVNNEIIEVNETNGDLVLTEEKQPETNKILDFLTDDDMNKIKMLNLKSNLNDCTNMVKALETESMRLINDDDEFGKYLDEITTKYTVDEFKSMSDEDIEKLYSMNGEPAKSLMKDDIKFKRDYLIFKKQTDETIAKFNAEHERLEKEIAESQEEFDAVCNKFGNISEVMRERIVAMMESDIDDDTRSKFKVYLEEFDDGFNLSQLKKYVSSYKGKNIRADYRLDKKSNKIYRQYLRVCKSLSIKTDLTKLPNLENKLPEKYHNQQNMFLFSVIHMIASWSGKDINKSKGIFISQLAVHVKDLAFDKFNNEETKQKFINNIIDVLDNDNLN